jgi:hypothetical protein
MPKQQITTDINSSEDRDTVEHLLRTVLVPSYPPNRSQWRKLELAMKFINKSLKSRKKAKKPGSDKKTTHKQSQRYFSEDYQPEKPQEKFSKPSVKPTKLEACKTIRILADSLQNLL